MQANPDHRVDLHPRSLAVTTFGGGCRFLNLCWFKNKNQSWMQTSRGCLYAYLPCNKRSVPNSWRHAPSPTARIQLSHVITYASRHYLATETGFRVFHFFTICNALMMITGVETFAICRSYGFHWRWCSLYVFNIFRINSILVECGRNFWELCYRTNSKYCTIYSLFQMWSPVMK